MTDYTGDHHLACQNLKVTSDQMEACYNQLANSAGFQEGDSVAVLPYPEEREITQAADVLRRPYIIITQINVLYQI
jgi:hypothetical protein